MSYQVLARKYRPTVFAEVAGQSHVLKSLINALDNQRLHHAYSNTYYVSQFYIFASSEKFLSNQKAIKKIKKDNTEALVKQFTNELFNLKIECGEKNIQSKQINKLILFFESNKSKSG